jgi:hypothetical protein
MVTHFLFFFIGALTDTNSTGDGVWAQAVYCSRKNAPFLPTEIHKMTDPTTQQRSYPCRQASSLLFKVTPFFPLRPLNFLKTIKSRNVMNLLQTSLVVTVVCWCEEGVNQGLLPMTISEEESNLFCACHLLNCDEGQGPMINHKL